MHATSPHRAALALLLLVASGCADDAAPVSGAADAAPGPAVGADCHVQPDGTAANDVDMPVPDAQAADTTLPSSDTRGLPDAGPPVPYSGTCALPPDDSKPGTLGLVDAFPSLPATFLPVFLTTCGDCSGRLFVVQQSGQIVVFPNDPAVDAFKVFLNIKDRVTHSGEMGLLGLAFHPDYAQTGTFFVNYTTEKPAGKGRRTVIARYTVSAGDPDVADPASEEILLEIPQPYANHNGGMIAFGPDGYLYIGMGDGGSAYDPLGHGQDITTLLATILRIDVDGAAPYGIPDDNPFAGASGLKRPEIWAYGMRNPWRFSFDRVTGLLWAGDVGQGQLEEVDIVERGGNYGWNVMEGTHCLVAGGPCPVPGTIPPVAEYDHTVGKSITGGYVYRGSAVPELYGSYVYGDYVNRGIFVFRYGQEPPPATPTLVAPDNVSSFGEDADGELYVLGYGSGRIRRLVAQAPVPLPAGFPTLLSETGCFSSLAPLQAAEGVLPYDVNMPLWSDGAQKSRWVALPQGGTIGTSVDDKWTFPEGTLFIKDFSLPTPGGGATRVETRLLVVRAGGVRGYSYRWNDAGTDASLLPAADTRTLETQPPGGAPPAPQTWRFPSRDQCQACHTAAAGGLLGPETRQLNRPGPLGANQIDALAALGLLAPAPAAAASLPAFPTLQDAQAPVADRARAWLHANCAGCHLPGGPSVMAMDLRATTPLASMMACDVPPVRTDLGVAGAQLLSPGKPDQSVIYLRMMTGPAYRMPPLGTDRVDPDGSAAVRDWIQGLADCL